MAFAAPKDTILARLKTAMKKENTTNNLIKFLHMENVAVLTFQVSEKNEIMKKHAEEYAEFYHYFFGSFFNEAVAEAIYKEWAKLTDIPFDEDPEGRMLLSEDFALWKAGTEREEIWEWFDEHHSKGAGWMMENNWDIMRKCRQEASHER